eukprot:scaffold309962_cov32-Prasinocladus_malaysianus.AAC.6
MGIWTLAFWSGDHRHRDSSPVIETSVKHGATSDSVGRPLKVAHVHSMAPHRCAENAFLQPVVGVQFNI